MPYLTESDLLSARRTWGRIVIANTKIILVTSFKGGVGKSTVTANLAVTLALSGKKTLALDCDFNIRSLDLILGLENEVIYDICDVVNRGIPFSKAVMRDSRSENLYFCAAPYKFDGTIDSKRFAAVIAEACESYGFDYILMDTSGGDSELLPTLAGVCDRAIIIATHQPASIRAAERTSSTLEGYGVTDRRLIINSFDAAAVKRGKKPGVIDIIDRTYIQLIGVIPFDDRLSVLSERGALVNELDEKTDTARAFRNIAMRLCGRSVPLFDGFSSSVGSAALK